MNRSQVLRWCLFAAALALVVWSADRLSSNRAAALAATENLEMCRLIARQITELNLRSAPSASKSPAAIDLPRRIESAALAAMLSPDQIVRIDPHVSRQWGETAYEERSTGLQLQRVSLKQFGTFLSAIATSESRLKISSLRLSSGPTESLLPSGAGEEVWQAEATLSYLTVAKPSIRREAANTRTPFE